MKALILNAGRGSRMGDETRLHPKCLTRLTGGETILSRQLRQLRQLGVTQVVMTTGYLHEVLEAYLRQLDCGLDVRLVQDDRWAGTNYIHSLHLAADCMDEDFLLLHGDLVLADSVLRQAASSPVSCMAVSAALPLPEKDFKAVVADGEIAAVGVSFFDNAVAAQPLYHLRLADFQPWREKMAELVAAGRVNCYGEDALNLVAAQCHIHPLDVGRQLCGEIDNAEDWQRTLERLRAEEKTVYLCFSADVLHSGHLAILEKAAALGRLTVGVLSDEAVMSYKRFPLLPCSERMGLFRHLAGVAHVVEQKTLSYRDNLLALQPDILVHGDDWVCGPQAGVRAEALETLEGYGGRLVEFPYARDEKYQAYERRARAELATPDLRRGRLKRLLAMKGFATALEAHSGLTGLIVEHTVQPEGGGAHQFDAMWVSSLCDSTQRGKPDIELVDLSSRFRTLDDLLEVTTKPVIFDGDTGGQLEHFTYTVRTLERMGVSMVIIEDKTGLKKNSLFGTEVPQTQDSLEHFCDKLRAGKQAQKTAEFMICARVESLILEKGQADALARAHAYVAAGADAIMIHSRREDPAEIFDFVAAFRQADGVTPLVVVPTTFHSVTEEEFRRRGVNVVIYANQLTRAAVPAMRQAAETLLRCHRAEECDAQLMPFGEIIRMIPGE